MFNFNLKRLLCCTMLLVASLAALAQKTITGIVSSEDGKPLPGATIMEKGTQNIVVSNAAGSFSIRVASAKSLLVVSFSGYSAKEIAVGSSSSLTVSLSFGQGQMDDVIVVGYGKQRKVTSVGAQASIGTKELIQSPVANISNSLVGRLPGLFAIQGSGEPGADQSRLLIRGLGTFAGTGAPLVLVDGIQVDNYNNIDPNELESVTILKDASSTAVMA
jgi:outer membrane receptor protein involved in Fe transport